MCDLPNVDLEKEAHGWVSTVGAADRNCEPPKLVLDLITVVWVINNKQLDSQQQSPSYSDMMQVVGLKGGTFSRNESEIWN